MENQVNLSADLSLSKIVHGQMRLPEWNLNVEQRVDLLNQLLELGITSIDQADIYGNYTSETLLGEAFREAPNLKEKFTVISKCGIALKSNKFPDRAIKHYNYSADYIISSVENSLKNMHLNRLDLLLLHRPSPLLQPAEVAKAFAQLKQQGKVNHFGISNFLPHQINALKAHLNVPLVTNQIELNPLQLEHFDNGNLDFCLEHQMHPMAWSPLAGGRIFKPKTEQEQRVIQVINEVAKAHDIEDPSQVIYAWILKHPSQPVITVGTGKQTRLKTAMQALNINLTNEDWFKIYTASTGVRVP